MHITQRLASLALSAGLVLLQTAPALAAKNTNVCPPSIRLEAQQRLDQLESTQHRLKDFMSGEANADTPLAALFVVDLDNEAAIQKRVKDLQALKVKGQASTAPSAPYLECVRTDPALAALLKELNDKQLSLDQQRLDFLSLPQDWRKGLISTHLDRQKQAKTAVLLAEERSAANKLQSEAALSSATAEERAISAASLDLREIAAQRALLEKTRETLGRLQAEIITELEERARFYQQTSERLSALTAVPLNGAESKPLLGSYSETVAIWRELVDRIFERIASPAKIDPAPDLPRFPEALLDRLKDSDEAAQYRRVYNETSSLRTQLESSRLQRFDRERNDLYRLLLEAGQLRSILLKENLNAGHREILDISMDYFRDIGRELRIVPYQVLAIFYSKAMDFRQKAGSGITGWIDIAKQSLLFLAFLGILFAAFTGLRRVSGYLERLRNHLIREKYTHAYARNLALWIRRVNPYVPWAIMLLGVNIAQDLVTGTDIAQIALILPYIAYYLWYRIFLYFTLSVIGQVAFSGAFQSNMLAKARLLRTVRFVGIFFFVLLALLHATQDAVGEALVYRLAYGIVSYVGVLVCAYAAREWQAEIAAAANELLPERFYLLIERLGKHRIWSWLVSLPALLLVILTKVGLYIKRWAGEFDFFKKISAAIFLRRIEHANKASGATATQKVALLPQDYAQWFKLDSSEDKSLLIDLESDLVDEVEQVLNAWSDNSTLDHSLALYGEKGSGKSSLLDMIELRHKKCVVRRIDIPPKLITRKAVLDFFGKELGMDLSKGDEALLQAEVDMPDTVLLIDNAQNLFLGELGGFEGYRTFAELMNSGTEHLFWCVTFNLRSWHYLKAVFGGMPLFRRAIEIDDFSETDIMNMVMARHRHTSAQLAYDDIIRATQAEDDYIGEHQVEKQFFRLLWGQSSGNPRAALMLWTTSLNQMPDNRFKVGLPKYPKVMINEAWGDDALFVYAAIMRHENLTDDEVVSVTSLPENIVINALGTGYDNHLLSCGTDGRYRITATAQASLTQLLLRKNFIYE